MAEKAKVWCTKCEWTGTRTASNASRPCPKCKGDVHGDPRTTPAAAPESPPDASTGEPDVSPETITAALPCATPEAVERKETLFGAADPIRKRVFVRPGALWYGGDNGIHLFPRAGGLAACGAKLILGSKVIGEDYAAPAGCCAACRSVRDAPDPPPTPAPARPEQPTLFAQEMERFNRQVAYKREEHPDAVLLWRNLLRREGYAVVGMDTVKIGKLLGINVVQNAYQMSEVLIPLNVFEESLKKILAAGHKVAVLEA